MDISGVMPIRVRSRLLECLSNEIIFINLTTHNTEQHIMQACIDLSMQTYLEIKRMAQIQWMIIKLHDKLKGRNDEQQWQQQ